MMSQTARAMFLLFVILFLGTAVEIFAAAGDLDLSFGGDGMVITDNGFNSESITDLVIQPDGKIVAVGYSQGGSNPVRRILIVRYNSNGSIDSTFGTGGKVSIQQRSPGGLALQPDGKIVFVSPSGTSPFANFYVGRLNSDGSFDTTFNGTGTVNLNLRETDDSAHSVKIQPDGKIVVGGTSSIALSDSRKDYAIVRFNADGSLDTTFDGDGKAFTAIALQNQLIEFSDLVIQPDGKIATTGSLLTYLGGNLDFMDFLTVRYNANGSLDTTFDADGIVTTRFTQPPATRTLTSTYTLAVQPDGKILVVGNTFTQTAADLSAIALARYNTDGSPDSSFLNGGKGFVTFPSYDRAGAAGAAIQADNKIVLAGSANIANDFYPAVARLNTDGSLDSSFSGDGVNVIVGATNRNSGAGRIAIQPNGRIVTGGYNGWNGGNDFLLMRFENVTCTMNCPAPRHEVIADFDGDGKTDLSVFRSGTWFINPSSANNPNYYYSQQFFSLPGSSLNPADFDGDGKTDIAIWRDNTFDAVGYFYVLQSETNTVRVTPFGITGDDTRAVGDWDSDGRADLAVYRNGASAGAQSFFFYIPSSAPETYVTIPWGVSGDEAVRGDFDGDGRKDAAVYRPSNQIWYVRKSSDAQPLFQYWGLASDKRIEGDFDGDGKTDFTAYRDGIWYVLQSSNSQPRYESWGISSDRVVAGDYDGDGKTDMAIYRDGTWYLLRSQQGFGAAYFGLAGDRPIPGVFVR